MIADFIHSASSSHHLNLGSLELNESLMRGAVVAFAYLVNAHHDGNKLPVTKNVALILQLIGSGLKPAANAGKEAMTPPASSVISYSLEKAGEVISYTPRDPASYSNFS